MTQTRRQFIATTAAATVAPALPVAACSERWSAETEELFHMACTIGRHDLYGRVAEGFVEGGMPEAAQACRRMAAEAWDSFHALPSDYPAASQARTRYLAEGVVPTIP